MNFDFARFNAATFGGIPDQAVLDHAVPPPGTFVRSWMEYMYTVTDAPLAYALGAGLATLSTLVPKDVFLPSADELHANMFVMVVGPSSAARKTFSVEHISKQLTAVEGGKPFLLSSIGSAEGFADEIITFPRRLILAEEGGHFLQHTIGGKYGAQLRALLLQLFDCSAISRITVSGKALQKIKTGNQNAGPPREDNPRASMLMACTKAHLEDFTFKSDWEGGFLSRFAFLWARRERHFNDAIPNPQGVSMIRAHIARLLTVNAVGPCTGFDEQARAYFRMWQSGLNAFAGQQDDRTSGVVDRAQQHAKKAALVLAYDRHTSITGAHREAAWSINLGDVMVGCALGTFSVQSALHIERNVTDNEHGQRMNRIMNFIHKSNTGARTFPEILRYMNRPMKTVLGDLETLRAAERLGCQTLTGAPSAGTYTSTTVDVWHTPDAVWHANFRAGATAPPRNDDDNETRH